MYWPIIPRAGLHVLRNYQQECIQTCLQEYLTNGVRRQLVSLPVGSGKTVIFSNLVSQVPNTARGGNKSLILAHREELVLQAYNHLNGVLSPLGKRIGIDLGSRNADIINSDVVVASVPSLGRLRSTRINKYDPAHFKCIVIDEAHHASASSYLRILDHFGIRSDDSDIALWGFTATARRHDLSRLDAVFEKIVFHKPLHEMITEGWLCNVSVKRYVSDLPSISDDKMILIVNEWLKQMRILDLKSTLVFAANIKHASKLQTVFSGHNVESRVLTSSTNSVERYRILRDFSARKFPVLINCMILSEGTDLPCVDSLIIAKPTRSLVLLHQMLGRGVRLYEGKSKCFIMDFVGAFDRDINIVPTLLGLDEMNKSKSRNRDGVEPKNKVELQTKSSAYVELEWEDVIKLVFNNQKAQTSDSVQYPNSYQFNWDSFRGCHYLYLIDSSCIEIRPCSDKYRVSYLKLKRFSFVEQKEVGLPCDSLDSATHMAEIYAQRISNYNWLVKSASWRKEPASKSQKEFARRLGVYSKLEQHKISSKVLDNVTKEMLQKLICRIIFSRSKRKSGPTY